nr:NAD(P)-dependent oxidoreductase [uncultured Carboxylicivirga sp.]
MKNVKIAFLGLGAMGSRMALNLLKAGYDLTVWNRTTQIAEEFAKNGAKHAMTPKEAVIDADIVISMVRDNEASKDVWFNDATGAIVGMKKDAIAIESSTLTTGWIKEMSSLFDKAGIKFLEAPVSGTRPQADSAQLIYFVAGNKVAFDITKPVLEKMGSKINFLGAPGNAAITKLVTNSLLGIQVAALSELIGVIKSNNADVTEILNAVSQTSPWAPINNFISSTIINQNFAPQFPVELISKDFDYISTINDADEQISLLKRVSEIFHAGIDNGLGDLNMTGISKLFE